MTLLKVIAVIILLFVWLSYRKSRPAEVSDLFVISFLLIYVPGFILNPSGGSNFNQLSMSAAAVFQAEISFLTVLCLISLVMLVRWAVEARFGWLNRVSAPLSARNASQWLAVGALCFAIAFFIAIIQFPDALAFRKDVFRFLTFQMGGIEHRILRNSGYSSSFVVASVLERARYTIFPISYCLIIYFLIEKRRFMATAVFSILFFIALPASLSKLPFLFYFGYIGVLLVSRVPQLHRAGWFLLFSLIGAALTIEALSILYAAQYKEAVIRGSVIPVDLAMQRIWGEPYSIIVRYFAVYPEILDFTGWGGVGQIAQIFGLPVRKPDIEVALSMLGPNNGSNPAAFFMSGYAAFGRVGLVLFSITGLFFLWAVDLVGRKLRFPHLKSVYVATMGMNVLFLNQIALQTAFLTYGLGIIPPVVLFLDYCVFAVERQSLSVREYLQIGSR